MNALASALVVVLLTQLGAPSSRTRDWATAMLDMVTPAIAATLERTEQTHTSAEVCIRCSILLDRYHKDTAEDKSRAHGNLPLIQTLTYMATSSDSIYNWYHMQELEEKYIYQASQRHPEEQPNNYDDDGRCRPSSLISTEATRLMVEDFYRNRQDPIDLIKRMWRACQPVED